MAAAGSDAPLPELTAAPAEAKGKGKAGPKEVSGKAGGDKGDSARQQVQSTAAAASALLSGAEAAAEAACKAFYGARDPKRPITRPEQIPGEQSALMDGIREDLNGLNHTVQSHIGAACSKLRVQVRSEHRRAVSTLMPALCAKHSQM